MESVHFFPDTVYEVINVPKFVKFQKQAEDIALPIFLVEFNQKFFFLTKVGHFFRDKILQEYLDKLGVKWLFGFVLQIEPMAERDKLRISSFDQSSKKTLLQPVEVIALSKPVRLIKIILKGNFINLLIVNMRFDWGLNFGDRRNISVICRKCLRLLDLMRDRIDLKP